MTECNYVTVLQSLDLPAAAITFIVLVAINAHYQYKLADLRSKERMSQKNGHTEPPDN